MVFETPAKTKQELAKEQFDLLASAARRKVASAMAKRRKLIRNLHGDLDKHGDPELWKRYGDLILANVHAATREGDVIRVTDYFDENAPLIGIEGEHNKPLNEIAEAYFRRYTKARNGVRIVRDRIAATEAELETDAILLSKIETAIAAEDAAFLAGIVEPKRKVTEVRRKKKSDTEFGGARRFVSTDGFEILVGKKAKDNDFLTFRVARSLDTWMHAADFPGSHVVIRNPNRKEIPPNTLHEAARLAAFYSNARKLDKAAVNYTQKKFVNKPKRAAPGLVSLASFKTLLVRPEVPESISNE
jgi:predicted ribosome quality control (RQC) complex YloA/Tae2 family protein